MLINQYLSLFLIITHRSINFSFLFYESFIVTSFKDPIELYTYNLYSYSYVDHRIEIFSIFPRKRSIPPFPSSLYPLTGIKGTGKNASQHPQFIFARGNHSGLANNSQRHLTRNGGSVILSCIYMYTCFSFGRRESVHSLVKSSPVWFFRLQVVRSVDELLICRRSPLISLSL